MKWSEFITAIIRTYKILNIVRKKNTFHSKKTHRLLSMFAFKSNRTHMSKQILKLMIWRNLFLLQLLLKLAWCLTFEKTIHFVEHRDLDCKFFTCPWFRNCFFALVIFATTTFLLLFDLITQMRSLASSASRVTASLRWRWTRAGSRARRRGARRLTCWSATTTTTGSWGRWPTARTSRCRTAWSRSTSRPRATWRSSARSRERSTRPSSCCSARRRMQRTPIRFVGCETVCCVVLWVFATSMICRSCCVRRRAVD